MKSSNGNVRRCEKTSNAFAQPSSFTASSPPRIYTQSPLAHWADSDVCQTA